MVTKGEKEITVLKLEHEEAKLFPQLIWSALLSFSVSLIIGAFTKQIEFNQKSTFSIILVPPQLNHAT